jgi:hypothetical protein
LVWGAQVVANYHESMQLGKVAVAVVGAGWHRLA